MTKWQLTARYLFFSVWAVLMTALTYILGAASLRVLRQNLGRGKFWGWTALIGLGLWLAKAPMLAVAFLSLVILVGVFSEFEEMGCGLMLSSAFTLLFNSLLAAGGLAIWTYFTGPSWTQKLLEAVQKVFAPLNQISPTVQVNYFDLMVQLPSIVLILWMGALYVSVLLEDRLSFTGKAVGPAPQVSATRAQLGEFRLPDACVWVFIVSLLGAFGGFPFKAFEAVSVNVMNVCLVMFFFQGIAVVARLMNKLRMGWFWQMLFMILIVVQLFLFVSVVGLVDYWFDFRTRMAKRPTQVNREEI